MIQKLLMCLCLAGAAQAATLATVDGKAITSADIMASEGKLPSGSDLRAAIERWIERRLIIKIARSRGLEVNSEEISRAVTLANRAWAPNNITDADVFRRNLAEEILIKKYIDKYVLPEIVASDDNLKAYFLENGALFVKDLPRDPEARKALFDKYRNETLYYYTRGEITRRLAKEAAAARKTADVKITAAG